MTTRHHATCTLLSILLLLAAACEGARNTPANDGLSRGPTQAESTLSHFLNAQLAESYDRNTVIGLSLEACDPVGAVEPKFWLVDATVLSSKMRGDTALVTAVVVTVASEVADTTIDGRVVGLEVRTDTATWRLVESQPGRGWMVCGISLEGVDFAPTGDSTRIRWMAAGESLSRARFLADSVRPAPQSDR